MKTLITACAGVLLLSLALVGCATVGADGPVRSGPPTMTVQASERADAVAELQERGCTILSQGAIHPASSQWVIQYECPE